MNNNSNQSNQSFEKNPNGGYLNPSNYGQDSWYGAVTITPELLQQIQATGKVLIEVKDEQTSTYGPCRRIVAKTYTPKAPSQPNQQGQARQGNGFAMAQQAQAPVRQPTQQGQAPQNFTNDSIPF